MITKNIIGFNLSAASEKTIHAFDPVNMQNLPGDFNVATGSEVDSALISAENAFTEYSRIPGKQKALFLRVIAEGIESLGEKLVLRIQAETGYPEQRILGERGRTCAQLRMFADISEGDRWRELVIDKAESERLPAPKPELRRVMVPIGPVVVFGASNFPLAYSTAGGDVASALAVGCPVIVKAHDSHLGTNALVAEVIMNAARATGMPDGVFSSLNGDGYHTGKQLVQHPLTAAVGFTGSLSGGRALFDLGNQREKPIPVFAEMGSVNPVFLLPGKVRSDMPALADQLVSSMTLTVGQFCTNPGLLFAINDPSTDKLIDLLVEKLNAVDAATMLNPGIAKSYHRGIREIQGNADVRVVTQSRDEGQQASPALAVTTGEVFLQQPHLHHEIFGPYSLLVKCKDRSEMEHIAAILEGQLTATVHTTREEHQLALSLRDILVRKAGRIIYNGVPTGVEVCDAQTHGGPYPATTDGRFTAVGKYAVRRWLRPVTFQHWPEDILPDEAM